MRKGNIKANLTQEHKIQLFYAGIKEIASSSIYKNKQQQNPHITKLQLH